MKRNNAAVFVVGRDRRETAARLGVIFDHLMMGVNRVCINLPEATENAVLFIVHFDVALLS